METLNNAANAELEKLRGDIDRLRKKNAVLEAALVDTTTRCAYIADILSRTETLRAHRLMTC